MLRSCGCPVAYHRPQVLTFHSWTPMTANKKLNSIVTSMMFQMVFTATKTHCTTCCRNKRYIEDASELHTDTVSGNLLHGRCFSQVSIFLQGNHGIDDIEYLASISIHPYQRSISLTFSPLALLIALKGLKTLRTLRILTTENCESLREKQKIHQKDLPSSSFSFRWLTL